MRVNCQGYVEEPSYYSDHRCERNLIGYQGCYPRQTLPLMIGDVNTIEECIQLCAKNYPYAGVRHR